MLVNLRIKIYESGLHNYQVAAAAGVPASVLSEIIYERRKANPELRKKLATLLNARQNWLFAQRRAERARIPQRIGDHTEMTEVSTVCEGTGT
jgi:plasmid maintenance system antidote protein VapI